MTDERSPRILISRLSHIGDCILTLPVLCALRNQFPHAYLGWVVERPSPTAGEPHGPRSALRAAPRLAEVSRELGQAAPRIAAPPV